MKAYIVTLGCPKNLVDSEATASLLNNSGCTIATAPDDADVLMVSACSFLDSAWQETVSEVERMAAVKKAKPGRRLVLMGCLPRHREEDIEKELPDVDHFLPTGAHGKLPGLIRKWQSNAAVGRVIAGDGSDRFDGMDERTLLTPPHSAYVKVAEGCNRKCTFCAIPIIRGRQDTRPVAEIVGEIEGLVARGTKEVTLLAQDIVSYASGGRKLAELMTAITDTGVDWVRIFYLHPAGIGVDYLNRLLDHPAVCRYLEMPVQHSSTRLLERMNRSYDRMHIENLIRGVRAAHPDIVIRSEVIVGFPGETETEFDDLKGFVEEFEFDSLGIFPYSREPGTVAAEMAEQVSPDVIQNRVEELSTLQEAFSYGARARFEGRALKVLVDRQLEGDEGLFDGCGWAGRFYGQALDVDGEVYLESNKPLEVGSFVQATIVDTGTFDLKGMVQ